MAPAVDLSVTENSVALKLLRLILWYCIDPHLCGWQIYRTDDQPMRQRTWALWNDKDTSWQTVSTTGSNPNSPIGSTTGSTRRSTAHWWVNWLVSPRASMRLLLG